MKLGLSTFSTDQTLPLTRLAQEAESRGFDCVFLTEHTHIPVNQSVPHPEVGPDGGLPAFYKRTVDPFVGLSFAAAATTTLKVGTGICLLAQRDPITTAKEVASLDLLSQGRFIFGIGFGWNADELDSHGGVFSKRRAVVRERIALMKRLWEDEVASFSGEYEKLEPSWSWPKPVQRPHPPIYLGGGGVKAMRAAAEWADVWYPVANPQNPTMEKVFARFRETVDELGRDPNEVGVAVAAAPADPRILEAYREQGVECATLRLEADAPDVMLRELDELTNVLSKLG